MSSHQSVEIHELTLDEWPSLKALRLSSLEESSDAYGANLEAEQQLSESQWRDKFKKETHIVARVNGGEVGVMSIERVKGDFGATCWIGGCWVAPEFRGRGVMRQLIQYLDQHAPERGWGIQGLGVFVDNETAIATYESLGFVRRGEPQPSTRRPGRFFQRMIREVKS